jgi:hypothetical protein
MDIQMTQKGVDVLEIMARSYGLDACSEQIVHFASTTKYTGGIEQSRIWTDVFWRKDDCLISFAQEYLDTYVPHWNKEHGSFGSFTFDAVAKTIRFEFNLLGVVQSSKSYPIGKE